MSKGHNRIRPSSQGKGKKEKDMAQNEVMASEEATEEVEEAVEVKNIYCRFYCYDGTERANVQDVKISQKQMEEILAIINR